MPRADEVRRVRSPAALGPLVAAAVGPDVVVVAVAVPAHAAPVARAQPAVGGALARAVVAQLRVVQRRGG